MLHGERYGRRRARTSGAATGQEQERSRRAGARTRRCWPRSLRGCAGRCPRSPSPSGGTAANQLRARNAACSQLHNDVAVHGKQLCGDVTTGSTHDRQLDCSPDMDVLSSTCGTVTSSLAASVRRSNSRCVSACACATSSSRPAGRHQKGKEASSCVQRVLTKPGSVNHARSQALVPGHCTAELVLQLLSGAPALLQLASTGACVRCVSAEPRPEQANNYLLRSASGHAPLAASLAARRPLWRRAEALERPASRQC